MSACVTISVLPPNPSLASSSRSLTLSKRPELASVHCLFSVTYRREIVELKECWRRAEKCCPPGAKGCRVTWGQLLSQHPRREGKSVPVAGVSYNAPGMRLRSSGLSYPCVYLSLYLLSHSRTHRDGQDWFHLPKRQCWAYEVHPEIRVVLSEWMEAKEA